MPAAAETEGAPGTLRERIRRALRDESLAVRDLSQALRASEREITDALPHVIRSVEAAAGVVVITPPTCEGCGYAFEDRTRSSRPSRCPECRATRVRPARFRVTEPAAPSPRAGHY